MNDRRSFVCFRSLLALFAALAVLVAPTVATASAHSATSQYHQQMTKAGHCDARGKKQEENKQQQPAKSCCASACMGMAVPSRMAAAPQVLTSGSSPDAGPLQTHVGIVAEIATPPPRTPEID